MSRATEAQASLPKQDSRQEEERLKREEKKKLRKLRKIAKRAGAKPTAPPPAAEPEIKQDHPDGPADADATMDSGSESEWEGFPDPPAPAAGGPAVVVVDVDVDVDETPAIEGKNGIGALQQSIAHQFPGDPRPATHALEDLLGGPGPRGLPAPSQPGFHTVDQLAAATHLWFEEYRGKQVRLGVVRKNADPVVVDAGADAAAAGHRTAGVLWIRSIDGNASQPDRKPDRFCGMPIVPAEVRQSAKTDGGRH